MYHLDLKKHQGEAKLSKDGEDRNTHIETLNSALGGLVRLAFVLAAFGLVIHTGWNDTLVHIFPSLTTITYKDAVMLALMSNIFFKSSCNCKS